MKSQSFMFLPLLEIKSFFFLLLMHYYIVMQHECRDDEVMIEIDSGFNHHFDTFKFIQF